MAAPCLIRALGQLSSRGHRVQSLCSVGFMGCRKYVFILCVTKDKDPLKDRIHYSFYFYESKSREADLNSFIILIESSWDTVRKLFMVGFQSCDLATSIPPPVVPVISLPPPSACLCGQWLPSFGVHQCGGADLNSDSFFLWKKISCRL